MHISLGLSDDDVQVCRQCPLKCRTKWHWLIEWADIMRCQMTCPRAVATVPRCHALLPYHSHSLSLSRSLSKSISCSLQCKCVRGSNKIANLPQSSLNGTMNNWAHAQNGQNGQATRRVAASIFGGKRLRANGKTFTQTTFAHTHTYVITFGVGAGYCGCLKNHSLRTTNTHTTRQMASLSIYLFVYMYVCV